MDCKICNTKTNKVFQGKILSKYDVDYYFCPNCEFLQTTEPFWLDEAYSNAISAQDTGVLQRNLANSILTTSIIASFFDINARFLDYGGGYGVLVRLMRDIGFDFVWMDKYAKNLFSIGFEYKKEDKIELITAFEVFEHLTSPILEIEKMFEISENILFSESILPTPPPKQDLWWYYAPTSGQHISFYSKKTLEFIAKKYNKNLLSYLDFHLFTSKDIKNEDFINAIKNDGAIYAESMSKLKPKTTFDMNYIIKNLK